MVDRLFPDTSLDVDSAVLDRTKDIVRLQSNIKEENEVSASLK